MAFLFSRLIWGRTKTLPQLEEGSSEGRSKRSSSSTRSRKSLLSKNGDVSITCQEASHYPLYDPADPEHNAAVPKSTTSSPQRKSRLERISQSLRSRCNKFYKFDEDGKPIAHTSQDSPSKKSIMSIKSVKSVRFDSEHTVIRDTQAPASPISIPSGSFLPELELPLSMLDIHGPSSVSLGMTARPVEEAPLTKMERWDDSFLEPVRSPLRDIAPNLETPLPGATLCMEVNPFDDVHEVESAQAKQAASPEANAATGKAELASRVTMNVSKMSFPEVFPEVDALEHLLDAASSTTDDLSAQYDADTESMTEPFKVVRDPPQSTKDQAAASADNNINTPVSAMKSGLRSEVVTLKPTVSSTSPPRQTTFHTSDTGEGCLTIVEGVSGPQRTESIASQMPPLRLRRSQLRLGPRMIDITASKADFRTKEYTGEVESDMSSMHLGSRASSTLSIPTKKPSTTTHHGEEAVSVSSTPAMEKVTDGTDDEELFSHALLSNEDLGMGVSISHGHGQKKKQKSTSCMTDHQLEQ